MSVVQELDLELNFPNATEVVHFDDSSYHGSSTIKRVDFIVEYNDRHIFVEIKDPDCPGAKNIEGFRQKLNSGALVQSLSGKFRDTLLFRSLQERNELDVVYIVLISMSCLDPALLLTKQAELKRSIPIRHRDWRQDCAASCVVMNVEQWRKRFGPGSIRRISEAAA